MSRSTPKAASKPQIKQTGDKEKDMQTWRETAGKQKGSGGKTLAQNLDDRNARVASNSAPNYTQKTTGTYTPAEVVFDGSKMSDSLVGFKGADSAPKETPKEKPKGTSTNFRTDIALLDKKKKK
jgi:hypothetical protein